MNNTKNHVTALRSALLTLLLVCSQTGVQAQSVGIPSGTARLSLTLDQAIALAIDQNRDVLVAEKNRYRADAQITEARAGAFPQISVSGNYTRNIMKPVMFLPPGSIINPTNTTQIFEIGSDNAYAFGATLSQTLFSRKVGVALDIARTYHEYSEESYRATVENVVFAVKKAFYGILLARKLVDANRQGLDIVRANFENVQAQFRHGTAAEFDLLRAEVQLANTEPLLVSAENTLRLSADNLKNILALPLETELEVRGDFAFDDMPRETLDRARKEALANNPAIAALAFQESILEKNISIESAANFPTLSLLGAYQWQTQDNSFLFRNYQWARMLNVGLQITFPLFEGFRTSARTEQASIDRDVVRFTRLKAEEGLKIQIQAAELRMQEARNRIAGQQRNIEQAEKAVRIAQTRYKSGVGTQLELLDAQVAMTRTQTNYAQAMYDFLVARAEWQNAVSSPQ